MLFRSLTLTRNLILTRTLNRALTLTVTLTNPYAVPEPLLDPYPKPYPNPHPNPKPNPNRKLPLTASASNRFLSTSVLRNSLKRQSYCDFLIMGVFLLFS